MTASAGFILVIALCTIAAATQFAITTSSFPNKHTQRKKKKQKPTAHPNLSGTCQSTFVGAPSCAVDAACAANIGLAQASNSETAAPISLETSHVFGNNELHLVVRHLTVGGRTLTNIDLSANAACNYPGTHWTKTVDNSGADCVDVYTAHIPWAVAYDEISSDQNVDACGLTRADTGDDITFSGVGLVSYVEQQPSIDGSAVPDRQVAQAFRFEIEMPQVIGGITATVLSFDDPNLERAITSQQFNPTTGVAAFSLLVSTAAPLRTTTLASAGSPANIAVAGTATDTSGCADQSGTATCRTIYSFEITPALGSVCVLNGTYTFTFNIACQSGVAAANCPLDASQTTLQIQVALTSEDLCVEVAHAITVTPTLTSHATFDGSASTFAFGAAKSSFFQSQTMFYKLALASNNGFLMASSKLVSVSITDNTMAAVPVFADGQMPNANWQFAKLDKASNGDSAAHQLEFEFKPHASFVGDVARLAPLSSTVTVVVEVTFTNSLRKRQAVQLHFGKQTEAHTAVAIVADQDATATAAAAGHSAPAPAELTFRVTLDGATIKTSADVAAAIAELRTLLNDALASLATVAAVTQDTATGQLHIVLSRADGADVSPTAQTLVVHLLDASALVKQIVLPDGSSANSNNASATTLSALAATMLIAASLV